MKKAKMKSKFVIGLLALLCVGLVTAGIIEYFHQSQVEIEVRQPISVTGNESYSIQGTDAGTQVMGEAIKVSNDADFDVPVLISSTEEEGINVSYVGLLRLSSKDTNTWEETSEEANIWYTLVGKDFKYGIIDSTIDLDGYTLIYYKDNEENANDEDRLLTAGVIGSRNQDLPHYNDWNDGESANYCNFSNGYDDYEHCKGAKLWMVPERDIQLQIGANESVLTWANWNDYLYETDLIRYFNNENGIITIPANSYIEFYPMFDLAYNLESGNYTITTSVEPVSLEVHSQGA